MIEDVQKFRFLKNLYKNAYAYGDKIDEVTVKRLYSSYFRNNTPGAPVNIYPEQLRNSAVASVDQLNFLMAACVFNIDVLYDSINDSIENLFETVTSMNNRIDQLRARRVTLEKMVDDLIFSISNSDGYYASFTEEFSDSLSIDLGLSSAYYDPDSRTVSIPSISSRDRTKISGNYFKLADARYTVRFNGNVVVNDQQIGNERLQMFDGLTDTYWSYTYNSNSNGLVSLQLDCTPIGPGSLSRIFVRLTSEKNIKVLARLSIVTPDRRKIGDGRRSISQR